MPADYARSSALVIVGAAVGAVIGAVDALDTIAGGFAAPLGGAGTAAFMLIAMAMHAAFGCALGAVARVVASRPGFARLHMRGDRLILAAGGALLVSLATSVPFFLGTYPWGVSIWWLGLGFGVPFCALVLVLARMSRTRTWPIAIAWACFAVGFYFVEARVVYQFSKQGLVYLAHFFGYGLLFVVGLVAVGQVAGRARVRLPSPGRSAVIAAVAVSLIGLGMARPALSRSSNQMRLTLHGRTSLTYRLLEMLPGGRIDRAVAAARLGCPTSPVPPAPGPAGVRSQPRVGGVLLLMVDTLRADRLGSYRRKGVPLTPHLNALADAGVSFDRAYTTAPSTARATRSMVTGVFNTGQADNFAGRDSLGALLRDGGVWTVAVSAHRNLWRSIHMFDRYVEIERGESNRVSVTAHETTAAILQELDARPADRPFFVMGHYYDPHAHYVANDAFDFGDSEVERYDAEVAYVDKYIGELLAAIASRGMDDVAVIVVSDHGDEFWEHRYRRHLLHLYDESVRVPFILHVPGGARGTRIATPVSVADVAPTVADLLGAPVPPAAEGVSLVDAALGKPLPRRSIPIVHYYDHMFAMVAADHKVIIDFDTGVFEHYDLAADPHERDNLADQGRPELRALGCELVGWLSR